MKTYLALLAAAVGLMLAAWWATEAAAGDVVVGLLMCGAMVASGCAYAHRVLLSARRDGGDR